MNAPRLRVIELIEGEYVNSVRAGIAHSHLTGHVGGGSGFDYQCEECGFEIVDGRVAGEGAIAVLADSGDSL